MRCPSNFQEVYREMANRYDAILIDGQAVLRSRIRAVSSTTDSSMTRSTPPSRVRSHSPRRFWRV